MRDHMVPAHIYLLGSRVLHADDRYIAEMLAPSTGTIAPYFFPVTSNADFSSYTFFYIEKKRGCLILYLTSTSSLSYFSPVKKTHFVCSMLFVLNKIASFFYRASQNTYVFSSHLNSKMTIQSDSD